MEPGLDWGTVASGMVGTGELWDGPGGLLDGLVSCEMGLELWPVG